MKSRLLVGVFAAMGVLILIFDAATATAAAQEALQLCIRVIIPSMFPFFVLINLLSNALVGSKTKWLTPLQRLLKLSPGGAGLFLCGLLGGYPTGAHMIHEAWRSGALRQKNAQRMLTFCSNAGPAFLFGVVATQFTNVVTIWIIWFIHIYSSILVGMIYRKDDSAAPITIKKSPVSLTQALRRSVEVMAYVCGWIILFRVLISFLSRWIFWAFPAEVEIAVISLLELANGCASLGQITNEGLRMIVASAAVNFGGICVMMQTASVTAGLHIGSYIKGKLLQTSFAVIMTVVAQFFLFAEMNRIKLTAVEIGCLILVFLLLLAIQPVTKITVDFRRKLLYNASRNK